MTIRPLLAALVLLAAIVAGDAFARSASTLPKQGLLEPGKALAGVRLGDTLKSVQNRWGGRTRGCAACAHPTWLYVYPHEQTGAAVAFVRGRVVAVYTIGAPAGWRTREGVVVRSDLAAATRIYGGRQGAEWRQCIGYGALTFVSKGTRTSIFVYGESVYGFSLAAASEPVCR